jgi:hypothetical protein
MVAVMNPGTNSTGILGIQIGQSLIFVRIYMFAILLRLRILEYHHK